MRGCRERDIRLAHHCSNALLCAFGMSRNDQKEALKLKAGYIHVQDY